MADQPLVEIAQFGTAIQPPQVPRLLTFDDRAQLVRRAKLLAWGGQCRTCRRWYVDAVRYKVGAHSNVIAGWVREFEWRERRTRCRVCQAATRAVRAKRSREVRSHHREELNRAHAERVAPAVATTAATVVRKLRK